jgi:DNA-binding GntR family transcriptional regulator
MPRQSPYELLRDEITAGRLAPGAPLLEVALADRLEVSRTPIREALRRLEQDGLAARAGRGLVVREQSLEEIVDTFEVRTVLEALAARSAASRHTTLDMARIQEAHDAMEAMDPATVTPLEMDRVFRGFHGAVWAASHNTALVDLLERLVAIVIRLPASAEAYIAPWSVILEEHRLLVDTIRSRDAEASWAMGMAHMAAARRRELKGLLAADHDGGLLIG